MIRYGLSQDGLSRDEIKEIPTPKPYQLHSDIGIFTVDYKFDKERAYKTLQVSSVKN
ncbi:MAG: hypothetical protein ABI045_03415 [Flavobacteriales bacterium]